MTPLQLLLSLRSREIHLWVEGTDCAIVPPQEP